MKKGIVHVLCSTGITLIVLAVAGGMNGFGFLCISSVFESFAANIVIHIGFLFTRKLESSYAIIGFMIDIGYTIVVLALFGTLFGWFYSTPMWMLVLITAAVYTAGILLGMIRVRRDIEEINLLLTKRNHTAAIKEET